MVYFDQIMHHIHHFQGMTKEHGRFLFVNAHGF